jgi:hypothetical protein
MPMLLFVGEVLGICSDWCFAFFTRIGKEILIALDTVGMFFPQDVPVTSQ